jgi:hypothetical protein
LHCVGLVHRKRLSYDEAEDALTKSYSLKKRTDAFGLACLCADLSSVYEALRRPQPAKLFKKRALDMLSEIRGKKHGFSRPDPALDI